MTDQYSRGRDTSRELTEVRTVLSRAENALETLERLAAQGDRHASWKCEEGEDCTVEDHWTRVDPDSDEMARALANVVGLLDRWRRTGSTRRDRWGARR